MSAVGKSKHWCSNCRRWSDIATTSLWHISGRVKDLIDYVENPEKTTIRTKEQQDFFNVFSYVENPDKTAETEYVTAINCLKETALRQMIATKKQYGKDDKYIAWHGYQSFKPYEIDPEECHALGVLLAKEMWGDRFQIIVTTHLDKDHLHNHFAFNSVSFKDGGKYNYSKKEQQRLRDCSDRICRQYAYSVIYNPHKAPSRPVWLDEKSGKPTRYNIYRKDIEEAIYNSNSVKLFYKYLIRKGYDVDLTGQHWKLKLHKYEHYTRFDTLDKEYTPDNIQERIRDSYNYYGSRRAEISLSPYLPESLENAYTPFDEIYRDTHIYRLFLFYCYQLGFLPKEKKYTPTSPYLLEDIRKMDEISAQTQYMGSNNIDTIEDLYKDRKNIEIEMEYLNERREKLRNMLRRAKPEEKDILRENIRGITEKLAVQRKSLKLNKGIETRSIGIQNTMNYVYENETKNIYQNRNIEREYER